MAGTKVESAAEREIVITRTVDAPRALVWRAWTEPGQIEAATGVRAPAIEIHTGAWCGALAGGRRQDAEAEWARIRKAAEFAVHLGLEVHAGHGLNYATAEAIAVLPQVVEDPGQLLLLVREAGGADGVRRVAHRRDVLHEQRLLRR